MSQPKDTFTARNGKTIALKAWTFELLAEHADDLYRFIDTWVQVVSGEVQVDEETGQRQLPDLNALKAVLPAIKASVQDPNSLTHVEGLGDMANLARAVWEYNEVSTGLGKFVLTQKELHSDIVTAATPQEQQEQQSESPSE